MLLVTMYLHGVSVETVTHWKSASVYGVLAPSGYGAGNGARTDTGETKGEVSTIW